MARNHYEIGIRSFSNRVMNSIFHIMEHVNSGDNMPDRFYVGINLRVCRYGNGDVGRIYCKSSVQKRKPRGSISLKDGGFANVGFLDPNNHRAQRSLREIGWEYDSGRMINNHPLMKVSTREISDKFEEHIPFITDALSIHFQREFIMDYKCTEEKLDGTGQDVPFD